MPFLIETHDKHGHHELRLATRDEHLAYLDSRVERLIACGAKLSDDGKRAHGGIYLVAVESRQEARDFIEADPFYRAGLFERVDISRWRQAYLDRRNTLND
ncbi:YciI family protein [Halomonas sp. I1]|uniref:YciI family protein n=1 Tax=Halomonas sp. I1 TaxID=393536 RepID=UPI0028DF3E8E|nr:YciI family protein [Halomonas sp. I1]MDT8895738.1 YciI family protein [Halomonas sp. I1]